MIRLADYKIAYFGAVDNLRRRMIRRTCDRHRGQASGKPGPQKFSGKAPALFCHKKSIFAAAYFPFRFFIYTSTASPFFMTLTLPLNLSSRGPGSRGMVTGGKASSKWSSTTFRGFSRRMVLTAGL